MASVLAHNLTKELQMIATSPNRGTTERRSPLWTFTEISRIRHHLLQRVGRLTEPQGKLTLTLSGNDAVKQDLLHFLDALKEAA
jgi:hypothetical protein